MGILFITFGLVVLLFSAVVHEFAHGYVAYLFGDTTAKQEGRLTLNPVRHMDPVGSFLLPGFLLLVGSGFLFGWAKPVPYNPYNFSRRRIAEPLVAAAGVLTNGAIAIFCALCIRFLPLSDTLVSLLFIVVLINVILAVINILPIPPLDGFKVLKGLASPSLAQTLDRWEILAHQKVGDIGLLALTFLFLFLLLNPLFIMINGITSVLTGIS